jgi:four helix bundle protein
MSLRPFDLGDRLIEFAVSVYRFAVDLPGTDLGRPIQAQVVRSATSPAANYGEAQASESRRDFIHKLSLCLNELRETWVWLEMVRRFWTWGDGAREPLIRV